MSGLAIEIKTDGALQRKIAAMNAALPGVDARVRAIVADSAFRVLASAKNLVPISTGALRRSMTVSFFSFGWAAIIGSFLPYAARQEFDDTLNHAQRQPRVRTKNTIAGRKGSVIKGTGQMNPAATWGFFRKSLYNEKPNFIRNLKELAQSVGDAWGRA